MFDKSRSRAQSGNMLHLFEPGQQLFPAFFSVYNLLDAGSTAQLIKVDGAVKLRAVTFALAAWAILAFVTGLACAALRRWLGDGSALHALVPGSVVMLIACLVYVLK